MAETEQGGAAEERPLVAETVVDIPETVVDDTLCSVVITGDLLFDSVATEATEGRMAKCVAQNAFTIHADDVIGSGSQGIVVRATDRSGAEYAAKISYAVPTVRDRRNRKAVLDYLISLMDDHPLGSDHYKKTHLMPLYAYGKISDPQDAHAPLYDVAIMALCESNLAREGGCSFSELQKVVIPQTAEGLRNLHVQGIVHRDIKPKNLYLLNGSIVLGDYGISSLLDAGRDTDSTVFDKRTPGYSPHSSVVQRENDWYALGYTIWTLYNGGIHPHQALIDADDLSAVLVGKQPVKFVPNKPEEASLGELIYGLTLYSSRGRLGYDDVQAWLEDPDSFHFDSPFEQVQINTAYQFKGESYTDNVSLANAMALSWNDAREHVYSPALEQYFTTVGQHDLAVRLHQITSKEAEGEIDSDLGLSWALSELKGSADEFCWEGQWHKRAGVADRCFENYAARPATLYETCENQETAAAIYRFLVAAFVSDQANADRAAAVLAAYESFLTSFSADVFLEVDKLLTVFELVCDDKKAVRKFFLEYGSFGNAVWVRQHLNLYKTKTNEARSLLKSIESYVLPNAAETSIDQMRESLKILDDQVTSFAVHFSSNPFFRMVGVDEDVAVEVLSAKAYRVAYAYGEACTIGFAQLVVPQARWDSICDYAALKKAAVAHIEHAASTLTNEANADQSTGTVAGHSMFKHIVLMVAIVLAYLWGQGQLVELSQVCQEGFTVVGSLVGSAGGSGGEALFATGFEIADVGAFFGNCSFFLGLLSGGFFLCAACVFATRVVQLIPVAFASSRKRHALSKAERIRKQAEAFARQPLGQSVERLLANEQIGSFATMEGALKAISHPNQPYAKAESVLEKIYRVSMIAIMLGIVGATITWVPTLFGYVTTAGSSENIASIALVGQGTLLINYAIYFGIVLKASSFRPNMIAVMFAMAIFPFVLLICSGYW